MKIILLSGKINKTSFYFFWSLLSIQDTSPIRKTPNPYSYPSRTNPHTSFSAAFIAEFSAEIPHSIAAEIVRLAPEASSQDIISRASGKMSNLSRR